MTTRGSYVHKPTGKLKIGGGGGLPENINFDKFLKYWRFQKKWFHKAFYKS